MKRHFRKYCASQLRVPLSRPRVFVGNQEVFKSIVVEFLKQVKTAVSTQGKGNGEKGDQTATGIQPCFWVRLPAISSSVTLGYLLCCCSACWVHFSHTCIANLLRSHDTCSDVLKLTYPGAGCINFKSALAEKRSGPFTSTATPPLVAKSETNPTCTGRRLSPPPPARPHGSRHVYRFFPIIGGVLFRRGILNTFPAWMFDSPS